MRHDAPLHDCRLLDWHAGAACFHIAALDWPGGGVAGRVVSAVADLSQALTDGSGGA